MANTRVTDVCFRHPGESRDPMSSRLLFGVQVFVPLVLTERRPRRTRSTPCQDMRRLFRCSAARLLRGAASCNGASFASPSAIHGLLLEDCRFTNCTRPC